MLVVSITERNSLQSNVSPKNPAKNHNTGKQQRALPLLPVNTVKCGNSCESIFDRI